MAMTPSQLSIIVKSQGVEKAAQDLDKLAKAAASVDSETKAFVVAQSKLAESNQKVGKSSEATARNISVQELAMVKAHEAALAMNAVISKAAKAQEELTNAMGKASRGVSAQELAMIKAHEQALKMNAAFDKQTDSLKNVSHHGSIFINTLKSMIVAATIYAGVNLATGIFKSADAWASMQSKLALATGSMNAAKVVQEDLYRISQNIRIPLEDTAKLYNRLVHPLMMMGKTSKDTTDMVSSMGYALKLSGATGQEAASAMLQFSQSMNAGRLNGGEFNSIAEASPNILRAIEAELIRTGRGAELSTKSLKKMAAEGQLTAQLVSDAMLRALPKWRKDFESLPLTVDGALVRIKNMWEKSIGTLAQDTGFAQNFTKLLGQLETAIPAFAKAVVSGLATAIEYSGIFAKTLGVVLTTMAASSAFTFFFGANGIIAGLTAAQIATKAWAGSMALLNSATGVIGLLVVGLWGLVEVYKALHKEKKSDADISKQIEMNSKEYLNRLSAENDQIEKQIDLLREKQGLPKLDRGKGNGEGDALGEFRLTDIQKLNAQLQRQQILLDNAKTAYDNYKNSAVAGRENYKNSAKLLEEYNKQKKSVTETSMNLTKAEEKASQIAFNTANQRMLSAKGEQEATMTQLKSMNQVKDKAEELYAKVKKIADESLAKGVMQGGISQAQYDEQIALAKKVRDATSKDGKARQKELTEEQEAIKNLQIELAGLVKQKELLLKLGVDGEKLLPAQKRLIEMELDGSSAAQVALQRKIVTAALAKKSVEDGFDAQRKANEEYSKSLTNAQEELTKNEALLNSDEKRIEVLARLAASKQYDIYLSAIKRGDTVQEIEKQLELYEVLKKNAGVVGARVDKDNGLKDSEANQKVLADLFDTSKIDRFENASTKALKGVIKGFAELSKVMTTYGVKQDKISEARRANLAENYGDFKKFADQEAKITEKEVDYKLASYADMADAAKNFFNEGTKGYQAMDAISKVYHAAQLARNLTEMTMMATKGVMNQAAGDVYTAIPRMAAMAAIMAGLGYATGMFGSSGSGGMKAADVQKTQGSGQRLDMATGKYVADGSSVFGDITAKSESITKSLEMLKSSYDKLYPVNQKMLSSLQSIEASMTGLANLIIKQGGIAEGTNFGIKEGTLSKGMGGVMGSVLPVLIPVIGSLISNLWGKTTQNIVDSGLQFGGSLSDLKKGQGLNQYASVDTTTSSWFGLKKDTKNTVLVDGMSKEINAQIGLVFTSMQATLEEVGKTLYGSSTGVTTALNNMVMDISKISLKGLSGDDVTKAINNVISKALDQMAATAFTSLDKFESVIGEGYAQKVIRIASTFATVNATMEKFNFKLFEMNDAGIQASLTFSKMFGTLQEMQGVTSSYFENFYREEDQLKIKTDAVTKIMKSLGQEMPTTREGFKLLVDKAQALGNTELVANLMKVSGAFAEVVKWIEKTADASEKMDYTNTDPVFPDWTTYRDMLKESFNELSQTAQKWLSISKQASDVRASINTILWGNSATQDAAVKKSEKLWKMMASDITVEQKLSLAGELKDSILSKYQLERDSVTKLIDFSKQLRTYVDSLKLGNLSPLTMTQKLAEARRQYETTLAKAQAGDVTAQGALTGSASAYLEIAKTAYASGDAYQAIFNNITSTLESMTLDTKSAEDKLLEINKAQEAELIRLVLQLNTVESVAASYYSTTIQSMSDQLKALNNIYKQMGVFDGVSVELSGLPAEIAAALSGTFGRTSGEDYVKALYSKYANKTGNQIDKEGMQYWTREFELFGREYVLKAFQDSVAKMASASSAPFAPAPMMAPSQASQMSEQIVTLKEEITKLREDAQLQTMALMETLTLTSKQNADRIVEGTTEGMDKNNPNWNKATLE